MLDCPVAQAREERGVQMLPWSGMVQPPRALQGMLVPFLIKGYSPLQLPSEEHAGSHIISPGQEPKSEFPVWLLLNVLLLCFIMLKSNRNKGLHLELRN